jgi:Mg-chelatase subunit ChlD
MLILWPGASWGQTFSAAHQKALNAYVDYANESASEISTVVVRIIDYYPSIHQQRSWGAPRYTCPLQQEDYYFKTALELGKTLPTAHYASLEEKLKSLRSAADEIDNRCKALDTYHKLEDYKRDNFAGAEKIVGEMMGLLDVYATRQHALETELSAVYSKLGGVTNDAYGKAERQMRAEVSRERELIDRWKFNLKQDAHTGWPVDKLEASILESDQRLNALRAENITVKYPASSMWKSFLEAMSSIIEVKRDGLDDYNFEARKSDKHSNDVYLSLINYYNGTLVSNFNMYIQYAGGDGHRGLKAMNYFLRYTINDKPVVSAIVEAPFEDIPRAAFEAPPQRAAITRDGYAALTNYVNFINETWRQDRYLQMVLGNFASSAGYYRNLDSFDKRAGMTFDYKNFTLPLSSYQMAVADSKVLPPPIARSLNDQSTVLLNILKEMNGLCASIELETREKRYEKDRLAHIFQILDRMEKLFVIWDDRKETLYKDVRKAYDSYAQLQQSSSWYVSGTALLELTNLNHDALFKAKAYYNGSDRKDIPTEDIDNKIHDVISGEYDNMKGIQKIGRNNGLCPYTPYEDLPVTSRSLSEELKALKPVTAASRNNHPYHRMLYHYNDIVDDYNKFCTLSKDVLLLPIVKQPELFRPSYPDPVPRQTGDHPAVDQAATTAAVVVGGQTNTTTTPAQQVRTSTVVRHDTIYIERRDTVYLTEDSEDLRSMDGYAINNMVLLLDASGSMNAPEKLPLLKQSILQLLTMMRPEDEISIIVFSDKPKALLTAVSFKEEERIRKAISSLKPSGKTDGNQAIKLAYKVADGNYLRGGNNRVILATDGQFALSDETRALIERYSHEDIFLSVFNFGKGAGASQVLEKLADTGKGNYAYISPQNIELRLIREAKAKKQK